MPLCACGCGAPIGRWSKFGPPPIYSSDVCARRAYRRRHPEVGRRHDRKRKYGITDDQFDSRFKAQGAACGICRTEDPGPLGWTVDHDHSTGKFRGILCNACNKAIGLLRDDPALVRAAESYLIAETPQ